MAETTERCEHFGETLDIRAGTNGCVDCMAIGATWNELRICLSCGRYFDPMPGRLPKRRSALAALLGRLIGR